MVKFKPIVRFISKLNLNANEFGCWFYTAANCATDTESLTKKGSRASFIAGSTGRVSLEYRRA
jgi:hypothetical protein